MKIITKDMIIIRSLKHFNEDRVNDPITLILNNLYVRGQLTVEKFNELVNDSWTLNRCDECCEDVEVLIRFGEDVGKYDDEGSRICINCLNKAKLILDPNVGNVNTGTNYPPTSPSKFDQEFSLFSNWRDDPRPDRDDDPWSTGTIRHFRD